MYRLGLLQYQAIQLILSMVLPTLALRFPYQQLQAKILNGLLTQATLPSLPINGCQHHLMWLRTSSNSSQRQLSELYR